MYSLIEAIAVLDAFELAAPLLTAFTVLLVGLPLMLALEELVDVFADVVVLFIAKLGKSTKSDLFLASARPNAKQTLKPVKSPRYFCCFRTFAHTQGSKNCQSPDLLLTKN